MRSSGGILFVLATLAASLVACPGSTCIGLECPSCTPVGGTCSAASECCGVARTAGVCCAGLGDFCFPGGDAGLYFEVSGPCCSTDTLSRAGPLACGFSTASREYTCCLSAGGNSLGAARIYCCSGVANDAGACE